MNSDGVIQTAHLYAPLHSELIRLLDSLQPEDWNKSTVCRDWTVRDIAAHLLDVDLRRLSFNRDNAEAPAPDGDLIDYLNRLNATWVQAARRLSPIVLLDLLRYAGPQVAAHVTALDPEAPSRFSVAWAGEEVSKNWFDIARDYTERWHHQQQIRDAVSAEPLYATEYLKPVLETFLRALPHAYRNQPAHLGTKIEIRIEGEAGLITTLTRHENAWSLTQDPAPDPQAVIHLNQDTAWRHFTNGRVQEIRIQTEGDPKLTNPFRQAIAIMAKPKSR